MLSIRKRIKKANRHYSLRKKVNVLKKNCNDKKNHSWFEDAKQKNDHLTIIMLFPNKA